MLRKIYVGSNRVCDAYCIRGLLQWRTFGASELSSVEGVYYVIRIVAASHTYKALSP